MYNVFVHCSEGPSCNSHWFYVKTQDVFDFYCMTDMYNAFFLWQ